ncbi:uncharacterized protein LOC106670920 [Cimex lectularius]|uniref:Uncharacterized protein n=1 Tax=Cimex lectularius TaxID=79782 RepID=A0A8I6S6L2_CIMLE|nr:uncharacterized protein LOC106670920 [Cimex lectularius]XP_014257086.1 uncharacterized protein LOC106670920 [Cimex lectularius]
MTQKTNNVGFEPNFGLPIFFDQTNNTDVPERNQGDVEVERTVRVQPLNLQRLSELAGIDLEQCPVLKFIGGCEQYCSKKTPVYILPQNKTNSVSHHESPILGQGLKKMFTNSRPNAKREEELIKEIERVQNRLDSVTEQLQNSKAEREKLEWKINEVQMKIKKESENLGLTFSENPSEDELLHLEKLTELAKEKVRRNRMLKVFQQKENLLLSTMGSARLPEFDSVPSLHNNPVIQPALDINSIELLKSFGAALSTSLRNNPTAAFLQE